MLDESSRREDPEQDRDVLLGRLVDEYFERRARGEPVNEAELLADHPELAEEFKAHIEAVQSLQPGTDTIVELIERGLLTPSRPRRPPRRRWRVRGLRPRSIRPPGR